QNRLPLLPVKQALPTRRRHPLIPGLPLRLPAQKPTLQSPFPPRHLRIPRIIAFQIPLPVVFQRHKGASERDLRQSQSEPVAHFGKHSGPGAVVQTEALEAEGTESAGVPAKEVEEFLRAGFDLVEFEVTKVIPGGIEAEEIGEASWIARSAQVTRIQTVRVSAELQSEISQIPGGLENDSQGPAAEVRVAVCHVTLRITVVDGKDGFGQRGEAEVMQVLDCSPGCVGWSREIFTVPDEVPPIKRGE
ncbi:MAG: hypothetical protein Q9187_003468, partial [Circinaria calcarea]